jgi:DNA-binding NarL/FixJ family response regulator
LACSLDGWFGVLASVTHSCARALADDPVGCAELIVNRSGGPELPCIYPQQRVYWFEILVRAELAQGNAEMAAEWAARAEASASGVGLAGQAGMAMLARAQVLASQDPATAAEHALAAASALSSAGCVLDAGRAHLLAGQTLSDPGQARYELKRAKVIFTECAAEGLNKSVLREQRRQAARVPRSRDGARGAGLGALTPRELETAQLVGEGLSNQMIARRLSVTIKTVEKHLSSVFAKVGVSSRAALAGMVARFDPESEAEAG